MAQTFYYTSGTIQMDAQCILHFLTRGIAYADPTNKRPERIGTLLAAMAIEKELDPAFLAGTLPQGLQAAIAAWKSAIKAERAELKARYGL